MMEGTLDESRPEAARLRALAGCKELARLADRTIKNADFARRGRLLLEDKQLELGPFSAVPMGRFGDWEADPLDNRSWQWRLNWLSFVPYLIAQHSADGDPRALCLAVDAALSWLGHFGSPARRHAFEFAWHDHATALRAEQLAVLIHRIELLGCWERCGGNAAAAQLLQGLGEHAELLAHDEFFSRHTNHGLEQARVQLLLATALEMPGDPAPLEWRAQALDRLVSELRHAFTDEGVHVENSPAYHAFVFKVFLGIVDGYPAETLGPLQGWISDVGPRALEFLARILRPDGLLPIIGDTAALRVNDSFRPVFEGHAAYEAFRYAWSLGRAGRPPKGFHKVYPQSGYAIFRSGWPSAAAYQRATHVVFKAGASSLYHRQQDDGSLVVMHESEDWLIDSGMFGYQKASPIRQYMRSRAAHNVVLVDRPLVKGAAAEPTAVWKILAHSEEQDQPFVAARNTSYIGVSLVRRVSMAPRSVVRVEDAIDALDSRPYSATILWHVPGDKVIDIVSPSEVLIRSTRTNQAMRLQIVGDLPDTIVVRAGVSKENVWSVVSHVANEHCDSQVIVFALNTRLRSHLYTELTFEVRP